MGFLSWIILGLLSGFIASKIVNKHGSGMMVDLLLGIAGAIVGGWLFRIVGGTSVTGINVYSLLVAVVGAIVLLLAYHAVHREV
jgi:uncharacterized membrane protein YeaQ/YmgE (transglycosylase-associated protein family)